jgi:two-component system, OmpR family, response regulator ChvI
MPRAVDLANAGPRTARIALVDDDPLFLSVFAANLRAAGYRTVCFDDPEQALASLQRDAPLDAYVLDWNMPGLDGLALFKLLRAGGVAVPVLFLTSYGQPIFEEAALDAGAADFVDKSRGPAIILHRLSLALARRDAPDALQSGADRADQQIGELLLSESSKRATWRDRHVPLSRNEFDVVALLANSAGRDIGYRQIYDVVRGDGFVAGQGEDGYRANVRAMVKRIRRKFVQLDPDFAALQNYPGFGYRWHRHG